MYKTRFGISVGLMGAAIYFGGLFGGYTVLILLAGYALLFEDNEWLKMSAVKAVALMVLFSLLTALLNLIPGLISFISSVCAIFNGSFSILFLTRLVTAITNLLSLAERVLFILLGLKAIGQGTVSIPVVDGLIKKYMA